MPKKKTPKKKIPSGRPSVASLEKKFETRKKTVSEQIADLSWEDIVKLTTSEQDMKTLMRYVDVMRQGMKRRVAMFVRKGIYSHAANAFALATEGKGDKYESPKKIVDRIMKSKAITGQSKTARARNALISEFAKYQQFFQSKTSSLEGINLVNAEQDERIFEGEYQKKSMTDEERKVFWHMYEDFMESPSFIRTASMTSETVQQQLAYAMFDEGESEEFEPASKILEGRISTYFDEYGIQMTYLNYEKGTKLRSMYQAYYKMQRAEHEAQIGRAERGENEFNIFSGGRNY